MSGNLEKILDEIDGFHCHICTTLFSTNPASEQAPAHVFCGHYVCVSCHRKLKVKKNKDEWSFQCCLCQGKLNGIAETEVARGYIDFMRTMRRIASQIEGDADGGRLSFDKFIKRFSGMRCQICWSVFSTDIHGPNPPVANWCGHYWCRSCGLKIRNTAQNDHYWVACRQCHLGKFVHKAQNYIAYGFMSTLIELTERLKGFWQREYGFVVDCSNCKIEIHTDSAVVCRNCEETSTNATHKVGISKKMSPLCLKCFINFHQSSDHKLETLETYANIKKNEQQLSQWENILNSVESDHDNIKVTQSRVDALVDHIKQNLKIAHKNVVKNCSSAADSSMIMCELDREVDKVKKGMEECKTATTQFEKQLLETKKRLIEICEKYE